MIAGACQALGADAVFVARLVDDRREGDPPWAPERPVFEVRLVGGGAPREVFVLANTLRLDGLEGFTRWNLRAAVPWLAILALLAYPFVRGWGSVAVRLDYDTKGARGFFHVKLTRRAGKVQATREKQGQSAARRWQTKVHIWSRFTRNIVENETRFRFVPARTWFVHVHGLLTDVRTKEVIGSYVEERQVTVERGQTAKLEFDLRAREAPIEVRLVQGPDGAAPDPSVQAVAALRGRPESIRYIRGGSAILQVGNGTHRVVVGVGDRVYEQQVPVEELVGASVCFALDRDEQALFTGCPAAVDPYVNGNLLAASQALDRAGQPELANLLRAEHHRERGEADEAARYYEAAGHVQQAAELSVDAEDARKSATLFEQAGDFGRAAEQYRETGDLAEGRRGLRGGLRLRGGHRLLPARGQRATRSSSCSRRSAATSRPGRRRSGPATPIARSGTCSSSTSAIPTTPRPAAPSPSSSPSAASSSSPRRSSAKRCPPPATSTRRPSSCSSSLGDLLERAGQVERALETFESIRKRDYTYPGAAERVETLRELRQSEQQASAFATRARAAGGAPTAAPRRAGREPLRDPRRDRPRRHGRGLPGARSAARPQSSR